MKTYRDLVIVILLLCCWNHLAWSGDAPITAQSIKLVNTHGLSSQPDPLWLESDESYGVAFITFAVPADFGDNLNSLDLVLQSDDRDDAQSNDGFSVVTAGHLLARIDQVQRNQAIRMSLDPNGLGSGESVDLILVPNGPDGVALRPQAHLEAHHGTSTSLKSGLVAEYRFNGNYQDSSDSAFHGIPSGPCEMAEDRFGRADSALRMNGDESARVVVKHCDALNLDHLTLSAWICGDSPKLWARILHKYNHRQNLGYALIFCHTEGTLALDAFAQDDQRLWIASQAKLQHQWQHLVVTYDGQRLCCYIDGKLDKSTDIQCHLKCTDEDLVIGNGYDGNHYFPWKGLIDDVRIYNRALDAGEVEALYNETPPSQGKVPLRDLRNVDRL